MKNAELLSQHLPGEWREHPRHPGYFFSRQGGVASWRTKNPKRLVGCECGRGYRAISVPNGDGGYGRVYIHRAVCELFNGGYGIGMHCRHLDTDMTNNAASNLAWGTPLENAADGMRFGKTCPGERNGMAKLTRDDVEAMKAIRKTTNATYRHIAYDFDVSTMTAFRAITGESWK